MTSRGAGIAAIVFAVVTLVAQFLSFVPYWLIETDGDARIGPWFKRDDNKTIGLDSFTGNDAEWHLAAASATLLILILSIFGIVAAVLHYRRIVEGRAVSQFKWCPPDLKTTLLIISIVQVAALITVAVCIAQARSTLRVKDATGAFTTDYHFGVVYWFYLVLSFAGVFLGMLSGLCLVTPAARAHYDTPREPYTKAEKPAEARLKLFNPMETPQISAQKISAQKTIDLNVI